MDEAKAAIDSCSVKKILQENDIFGSDGEVSIWDFSRANISQESRVDAVQRVASVCFQSDAKVGTSALYDKLMRESLGLPSSSFEFVPVLLNEKDRELINIKYMDNVINENEKFIQTPHIEKFGTTIVRNGKVYRLTNLRALLYDISLINSEKSDEKIDVSNSFFNQDEEEISIIKKNFYVFHMKIDIVTARQLMRHRASWQELSRRYVSSKKVPFEVYLTEDMKNPDIRVNISNNDCNGISISASNLVKLSLRMYDTAIKAGIKPQDARRIIPQGALTQVWSAWFKPQFDNMVKLRSAPKAQWEIRTLARSMNGLVKLALR